jgi:hypothetical protein
MKHASDTSFFQSQALRRNRSDNSPDGQLFLGHKLLGELKILMRLSSGPKSGHGHNAGSNDDQSSF